MVIIDLKSSPNLRFLNFYRSFNTADNQTPREFFKKQLGLLKSAVNNSTILTGDFNLDCSKKELTSY
jgi:hypothetical protein